MTEDGPQGLELTSSPDDATIAEGLARAYRPYVAVVAALFLTAVPAVTVLRAWADGAWLVRSALAVATLAFCAWATRRGLRDLVKTGVKERSDREVHVRLVGEHLHANGLRFPLASVRARATDRALVLSAKGLPAVVLARSDVPGDARRRLRVP